MLCLEVFQLFPSTESTAGSAVGHLLSSRVESASTEPISDPVGTVNIVVSTGSRGGGRSRGCSSCCRGGTQSTGSSAVDIGESRDGIADGRLLSTVRSSIDASSESTESTHVGTIRGNGLAPKRTETHRVGDRIAVDTGN